MSTYPTSIGDMQLETNWSACEEAFRRRLGTPLCPDRSFLVAVNRIDDELPGGGLEIMDAKVFCERDSIHAWVPDPSFMAGAVLDWLWLAIPQWCAPDGWELLHAAAVERDGEVTLIVGESGAGKTTVLLALLDAGWRLVSDDGVLLHEGAVIGWGTDLHLDPAVVRERWPEIALETLDFNGKVRLSAQAAGLETAPGGTLTRVISLSTEDAPPNLRHRGEGFAEADHDFARFDGAQLEWWGRRPDDFADRIAALPADAMPQLVVSTPFSGKQWALERWIEGLLALNLPPETTLLWLCNSEDDEFWSALQAAAEALPLTVYLWRDTHRVGLKDAQVAYLWQQIRTRLPEGCEAVLTLEDDVIPEPGAIAKLVAEFRRRQATAVVGIPVAHDYAWGETVALAWEYHGRPCGAQIGPRTWVTEAPRRSRPHQVDALSFSCTMMSPGAFHLPTLTPGHPDHVAGGYDHAFCQELGDKGIAIIAAWNASAVHLRQNDAGAISALRLRPHRVWSTGGGYLPDRGASWEQVGEGGIQEALADHAADFLLVTSPDASIGPAYLDACLSFLATHPAYAACWGLRRGPDGRLDGSPDTGAVVRLSACREANANTIAELRRYLATEGWREGIHDRACFVSAGRDPAGYQPIDQPATTSPYRICMINRDRYRGEWPGFGGDFTQIDGYRRGLRTHGVWADLRHSGFRDFADYQLLHLHHTQFPWAWRAAWACDGRLPVVVSTITHGSRAQGECAHVVDRAQHLICYSRQEAAWYAGRWPETPISVVPMGVNPGLFSVNGDIEPESAVLMAGKLCDYKNQLSVLEACRKLDVPVRFAAFNEDPIPDPYVAEFAQAVEAYPKAEMLGFLHGEQLWDEYRRAHVHVNASRFEPFGQVTLDAIALGCNVVHSRESWAAEQFGRVGSLCDPADIDSIAESIDTELQRRRGWANVRPPTYAEAALPLMAVYEEVLAR